MASCVLLSGALPIEPSGLTHYELFGTSTDVCVCQTILTVLPASRWQHMIFSDLCNLHVVSPPNATESRLHFNIYNTQSNNTGIALLWSSSSEEI